MRLPKLGTVTLIKDKDDALIFKRFHLVQIFGLTDRAVKLLDRRDNQLGVVG